MALSLRPKFNDADIKRIIQDRMDRIENAVVEQLKFIGNDFVTNARNNGTYTDQTGNLRSSIGYLILKNGLQLTQSGFEQIKTGSEGTAKGKAFLQEVAAKFPTGIVLIVVAGMDYAAAVESKGRDVLTGSSPQAIADLKTAMQRITTKMGSMT